MSERLTIRQFGPIQEAIVELRDLTIFVGPQASGKSLAAQSLYFLKGIEELLPPSTSSTSELLETILLALELWFGCAPSQFVRGDTSLAWSPSGNQQDDTQEIVWRANAAYISPALEQRVQQWWKSGLAPKSQIYIPSGRTLYSFVPPYAAPQLQLLFSRGRVRQQLPGYISAFYSALGSTIESLWKVQQKRDQGLISMFDNLDELQSLRLRMESITRGQVRYGPSSVALKIADKLFESTIMSAGQMEIWPFLAIAESIVSEISARPSQMYFEEPEAHLHPGAQRTVAEIIAQLVKNGVRLVITTHSPYLLYAINNFLMAGQVLAHTSRLPDSASPDTALRADQVAAYRFSTDGHVYDIMDSETGLIDEQELDKVASDLGVVFTNLQDQLENE